MKDQEVAERDHARFIEHLDASNPAVFQCAKFFYDKGIQVAISPMTKSKDSRATSQMAQIGLLRTL